MRGAVLEGAAFFSIFDEQAPQINVDVLVAYFILIRPTFVKFTELVRERLILIYA